MGLLGKIGGTIVGDSCIACQVTSVVILLKQCPIQPTIFLKLYFVNKLTFSNIILVVEVNSIPN